MTNPMAIPEASPSTDGHPRPRVVLLLSVAGNALWIQWMAHMRRLGWEVETWEGVTEAVYRGRRSGLGRLWMRVEVNLLFMVRVAWRMWSRARREPVLLLVPSTPFFAPAFVGLFRRRKDYLIQLLYDLYPETLEVAGLLRRGSLPERAMARITRFGLDSVDATVLLGRRLREHVEARYRPRCRCLVIPVGADGTGFTTAPGADGAAPDAGSGLSVVYVGNFGYLHDWETLATVLRAGLPERVRLAFHASGRSYERLKSAVGDSVGGVSWGGALGREEWLRTLRDAPVGLVTFARGAEVVAFPSKTLSSMTAGQAILAITPSDSDLAEMIREHACGWVVEPGDAEGLRRLLGELAARPDEVKAKREAAYRAGHSHYEMAVVARSWSCLLEEAAASIARRRADGGAAEETRNR